MLYSSIFQIFITLVILFISVICFTNTVIKKKNTNKIKLKHIPLPPKAILMKQKNIQDDIVLYIHICMIGDWISIFSKLIHKCQNVGLFQKIKQCNLICLGQKKELRHVRTIMDNYINCVSVIRFFSEDISLYERPTLQTIWNDSINFNNNTKILYLHSKGVTRKGFTYDCVQDWVDFMVYYLIEHYLLAITLLQRADVVGVNYMNIPMPHFSGNFWWANSHHIRNLNEKIGKNYLDPEMWVCKKNAKIISMAQSSIHHYFERYPKTSYMESQIFLRTNKKEYGS